MSIKLIAIVEDSSIRLDQYIVSKYRNYSRTIIQECIRSGDIKLNGNIVKPSILLKGGEVIKGEINSPKDINHIIKQDIKLNIIFEDDDVLVLNKSAGLVVHPGHGNPDNTLLNGLVYHYNKLSNINSLKPGIVHRLDKDTSGVMIVAKNDQAHMKIAEQFQNRLVKKQYIAIVWGKCPSNGNIQGYISRQRSNRIKFSMHKSGKKFSRTQYKSEYYAAPFSLLSLYPETGRTHQIRVSLSHIGYPIVCDELYGGGKNKIKSFHSKHNRFCKSVMKNLGRIGLHAYKLTIKHPLSSKIMEWEAPIPNDILSVKKIMKEYE